MFNQYTFKTKVKFLGILFLMLSVASYRRSFSNLIDLYKENSMLTEKKSTMNSQSSNIYVLQKDVKDLDKLIGKIGVEKENIQQKIIDFSVKNGKKLEINSIQTIHESRQNDYLVYTYQIDLTGNYNNLLELTYEFEKKFEYSKIVSTKFYTENKNNKKEILHLNLIFQNYENTN
ncbi:hypothetical protein [Flavobacterium capsici]|uniref:Uncharacterized protein n=1 Tax=Flavobacterium capsici TaxID=3075618 RepID=A0AA96J3L9_9FLAO|nr:MULTISPECIES: hypothetical protein [unclassified Flavobacterium]WNM19458.1 hypothetical protein RN608_01965 [Flavobacterium sp. PMR2A8]WNM20847.1 hypothetical protein RN605_09135 [Flavobacterium sp. PMTSA4]